LLKSRIFPILPVFLAVISIFTSGCGSKNENTPSKSREKGIQVKGSDTMVNLVEAWAEKFIAMKPEVNMSVTGGGSGTGFAALLNATCDIAMASRMIEDKERETAKSNGIFPVEFKVGLDGLVVIAHSSNPVNGLTLDQIRDIFMANITDWKQVGGNESRIVILSRESNSGTHLFFKEQVLRKGNKKSREEFAPGALLMPSSQAIVNEVIQNPHAIGYVGIGYLSPQLKGFQIEKSPGSGFVKPAIENVAAGRYPISRPLFLYTNGEPTGAVKEFIDYALSAEGQAVVRELDFVPIGKP
jgi:phosphate transport system substrate-binding protein